MSRHMFEAAWTEFSRRAAEQVRAEHGDPEADVRYYAEKHQDTRLIDLDELPPDLRVLVLVRDPRDMYVSFLAFDAKRQSEGRAEFEAAKPAPGESEDERLGRFIDRERTRMRWIAEVEGAGTFPVVPLRGPRHGPRGAGAPARGLALHRRSMPTRPRPTRSCAKLHVSARTPEASVGRWRTELDPGLAERFSHGVPRRAGSARLPESRRPAELAAELEQEPGEADADRHRPDDAGQEHQRPSPVAAPGCRVGSSPTGVWASTSRAASRPASGTRMSRGPAARKSGTSKPRLRRWKLGMPSSRRIPWISSASARLDALATRPGARRCTGA